MVNPRDIFGGHSCNGGNWVEYSVSCAVGWSLFSLLFFGSFVLASILDVGSGVFLPSDRYLSRHRPSTGVINSDPACW